MARSGEGMSTSTKVILAVLGVGGVLALVCCGGLAWWGNMLVQDLKQGFEESFAEMEVLDEMYIDDPVQIAELTASICDIRIPPRYEPNAGEDLTTIDLLRKQVSYDSSDGFGRLMIREMLRDEITTLDESAQILADELSEKGWDFTLVSATSSRRTFTISGEECVFDFQSGKDTGPGNEIRQVTGFFPSESGLAYLIVYDRVEHWDEAAIVAMIESIKMGQPGPAAESTTAVDGPDAATPTDTRPDAPAETPADLPGETPDIPDAATTTPPGTQE